MKILAVLMIYMLIATVISLLFSDEGPIEEKYMFMDIIKWKEINILGKALLIILMFPVLILEYILNGFRILFTWHPKKK